MKTFTYLDVPKLDPLTTEERAGKRFYVTPSGTRLPSVTTVLSHAKKDSLKQWQERVGEAEATRVRNVASNRGTKFHTMMERYLTNCDKQFVFEGTMPDMRMQFYDMRDVVDDIDNIHHLESPLYSETLGVAGRTDVIAEFRGVPSIIDFKTSLKLKKPQWITNYFEQGTAYSLMYEELTGFKIEQVVILISVDQECPQTFVVNRNDYIDSLKAKIEAYNKEHAHVC